jgi:transcriptional regulator with XRE-family HTH domain
MRFPHVTWAAAERGIRQYRLASMIGLSEARLSRCLAGRSAFAADERAAISRIFGLPESWLFEEISPPLSVLGASPEHTEAGE